MFFGTLALAAISCHVRCPPNLRKSKPHREDLQAIRSAVLTKPSYCVVSPSTRHACGEASRWYPQPRCLHHPRHWLPSWSPRRQRTETNHLLCALSEFLTYRIWTKIKWWLFYAHEFLCNWLYKKRWPEWVYDEPNMNQLVLYHESLLVGNVVETKQATQIVWEPSNFQENHAVAVQLMVELSIWFWLDGPGSYGTILRVPIPTATYLSKRHFYSKLFSPSMGYQANPGFDGSTTYICF